MDLFVPGYFLRTSPHQAVALGAKFIHLGQHPAQKFLSRNRAYPGPLKVPNLRRWR
jgi:hypothetical protein